MNALLDFPSFIDYFRKLSEKHKKLKGFSHGSADRIIQLDRSELTYPALWLETPSLIPDDNGADNITGNWIGAIVVLINASDMTFAEEDQAWAESLSILQSVLSKVLIEKPGFKLTNKPIDPINTLLSNKLVGWRYEFELEENLDLIYDESDWEEGE